MAELASKSGIKRIVWDYFGLEVEADGKPLDDGSAVCQRLRAKHGNFLKLVVGSATPVVGRIPC